MPSDSSCVLARLNLITHLTHATCGENGSRTVGQGLYSAQRGGHCHLCENQEASDFEGDWRGLTKEPCLAHLCPDIAWVPHCGCSSEPISVHCAHVSKVPFSWLAWAQTHSTADRQQITVITACPTSRLQGQLYITNPDSG